MQWRFCCGRRAQACTWLLALLLQTAAPAPVAQTTGQTRTQQRGLVFGVLSEEAAGVGVGTNQTMELQVALVFPPFRYAEQCCVTCRRSLMRWQVSRNGVEA